MGGKNLASFIACCCCGRSIQVFTRWHIVNSIQHTSAVSVSGIIFPRLGQSIDQNDRKHRARPWDSWLIIKLCPIWKLCVFDAGHMAKWITALERDREREGGSSSSIGYNFVCLILPYCYLSYWSDKGSFKANDHYRKMGKLVFSEWNGNRNISHAWYEIFTTGVGDNMLNTNSLNSFTHLHLFVPSCWSWSTASVTPRRSFCVEADLIDILPNIDIYFILTT